VLTASRRALRASSRSTSLDPVAAQAASRSRGREMTPVSRNGNGVSLRLRNPSIGRSSALKTWLWQSTTTGSTILLR
jgi:hypothetical protein